MSGTITHSWNGTILTVTSDSGTSSADLKGEKGDTGIRGAQGAEGKVDTSKVYTIEKPPTTEEIGAVPNTRIINNHILDKDINLTAADVGAVPTTRKVNDKELSADITLTAADVGARDKEWIPTAAEIGAVSKDGDSLTGSLTVEAQASGGQGYIVQKAVNDVLEKLQIYVNASGLPSIGFYEDGVEVNRMVLNRTNTKFIKPVSIDSGGTNATTAEEARENLGVSEAQESSSYPNCYYRTVDSVTEWINPPMVASTEYRTTERYQGKVVYTAALDVGALPNASTKTTSLNGKFAASVLRYNLVVRDASGNERNAEKISGITDICIRADGAQSMYMRITTTSDLSNQTAKAQIWYTY